MLNASVNIDYEELVARFQPLPERIARNRRHVIGFMVLYVVVASFLVALSVVACAGSALLWIALWRIEVRLPFYLENLYGLISEVQRLNGSISAIVLAAWIALVLEFLVSTWLALRSGEDKLLVALNAEPMPLGEYREVKSALHDVVIATGAARPKLVVVHDRAINAFAISHHNETGWIGVTTGLVDSLSIEELRCVLAHLVARLQDGSARTATILSELFMVADNIKTKRDRFLRFFHEDPDMLIMWALRWLLTPFVLHFLLLHAVADSCGSMVIGFTKSWYRRKQCAAAECADAMAVSITKDPANMIRALSKVLPADNRPGVAIEPMFKTYVFGAVFFAWPSFSFADDPELVRVQRLQEILGPAVILPW